MYNSSTKHFPFLLEERKDINNPSSKNYFSFEIAKVPL